MLADLIFTANSHPFISGVIVGAVVLGAPSAAIAWFNGYETCIHHVWRQIDDESQVHGDVPNLPRRAT